MAPVDNLIILFTRFPSLGKCKTRLAPALGKKGATNIHKQLVARTIATLEHFTRVPGRGTYHIYFYGASLMDMERWLGNNCFVRQQGRDLGERMLNGLNNGLKTAKKCILIGSDCPGLSQEILQQAFQALDDARIVLGPAHDGGYYLIGSTMSEKSDPGKLKHIFQDIPWGTEMVLPATLEKIRRRDFSFHLLPTLRDIDTPDDLRYFHYSPHS